MQFRVQLDLLDRKLVSDIVMLSIPIFLYQLVLYVDLNHLQVVVPHYDFAFYAQLADSFTNFGNENKGLFENVLFKKEFNGVAPYHYPEIWYTTILAKCFSMDALKALLFVAFPSMKIAVVAGIFSLFNWDEADWTRRLYYFLLVFITPVFFDFFLRSEYTKYYLGFTQSGVFSYFGNKYLPIYLVALTSMKLYLSNRKEESLIIALISGVFSIGTLPAILGSVVLCLFLLTRSIKRVLPIILVALAIGSFYKFFAVSNVGTYLKQTILVQKIVQHPTSIQHYKTFLFAFVFPYLRLFIFYLPFLGCVVYLVWKRSKPYQLSDLVFVFVLTFIGAFCAAMLTGMLDATQLLYNTLPFVNVFFMYHLSQVKWSIVGIMFLILCTSGSMANNFQNKSSNGEIYSNYHSDFMKQVLNEVDAKSDTSSSVLIAYSLSEQHYQLGVNASRYTTPCFFMNLATKPAYFIDINTFRFDQYFSSSDFINAKNEIKNFRKHRKMENSSVQDVQLDFLRTYQTRFLIVQNGAVISSEFLHLLPVQKVYHDTLSHDVVYCLDWTE